jgi:hypothetical protein
MKMKKLPSEANSEKGDLSGEGRLGENRELMEKNRTMRRGSTPPRTSQPTTPDGEANLIAVTEGSMEPLKNEP